MTAVNVRDNIDAVLKRMRGFSTDVVDKAIPRALNRTAEQGRTQASREMRADGYGFSASEVKAAVRLLKASRGRLTASMNVRRATKSLMEFGARQTKEGVSVKVHKGRKVIRHAFIGQLRNGSLGVYVEDKAAGKTVLRVAKQYKKGSRGGWQDYSVRKLYGPSVGGAYSTEQIQRVMLKLIGETFTARLQHEIKYLSR